MANGPISRLDFNGGKGIGFQVDGAFLCRTIPSLASVPPVISSVSRSKKMLKKAKLSLLFTGVLCASFGISRDGMTDPGLKYGTVNPSSMIHSTLTVLTIKRTERINDSQWGELYVNGKFICFTLENYPKEIPPGSYKISKTQKGFRLNKVPGRTNINIEIGNYPFESLGCIFVGTKKTPTGVANSRIALLRLAASVKLPALLVVS